MADELEELLAIALRANEIAAEVIMPLYQAGIAVDLKEDRTPVTEADRNAELAIREFLARECPGHGIVGEEFGETAGDGRHRWILDPIDGTASFIRHVPLFGTLVALERDGVPLIGVIGCHAAGETAYAAEGHGAFINGAPIRVSAVAQLRNGLVCVGSTTGVTRRYPGALEGLLASARWVQTWGDCYGYLMVASGRADAMLDPVMSLWDVAALYPVIMEAGGRITTWQGEDRVGESAIASNGTLHAAILEAISGG
ncbi:MAG: inositol monophosphatase family protein [Tepidiformaceae bacterium]